MKRFTATVLVMLAGFCTAGRLQAQSHEARATVPFNFIVGNKQLPAGSYLILSQPDETVVIENRDRPAAVISRIISSDGEQFNTSPHLVFNKYGDHYFLSEIRCTWATMNGTVPRSKLQRQAEAQQASLPPETILLAAE